MTGGNIMFGNVNRHNFNLYLKNFDLCVCCDKMLEKIRHKLGEHFSRSKSLSVDNFFGYNSIIFLLFLLSNSG